MALAMDESLLDRWGLLFVVFLFWFALVISNYKRLS
jgi:hypothetical protein